MAGDLTWKSSCSSEEDPKSHGHGKPLDSPIVGRKKSTVYRVNSGGRETAQIAPSRPEDPVEIFLASDASAIIEHTNKVIFLEDDDVAAVRNGVVSIHRITRSMDDTSSNR